MTTVSEIINHLLTKYNYNDPKYLEIGVWAGYTLSKVNCIHKDGVDPEQYCPSEHVNYKMTSDEFFKNHCKIKYDIIFIDGLHTAFQVSKDLQNAIKYIKSGGWILLDDVHPLAEEEQEALDLRKLGKPLTGDVWKAVYHIFSQLDEICEDIKFANIGRGLLMLKIKENNISNIIIDPDIPTVNVDGWYPGPEKEWKLYNYNDHFFEYKETCLFSRPFSFM